jgi:hypothetical protein
MSFTVITTVEEAAINYDLVDIATVKDELSIKATDTSNDTFLKRAISQTSTVIANYCNRIFAVETLQDRIYIDQDAYPYQVPGGVSPLQLSRFPVFAVTSVKQLTAINVLNTLTEGTDFKVDPANGWLIRIDAFTGVAVTWEALPVIVEYTAGYSATAVQPATVPASPFTITVTNAAYFAQDQGVTLSDGTPLIAVDVNPGPGQYSVSPQGVYLFNVANLGVTVNIGYVFTSIPLDLVDAALRLITQRFRARGRDPMLTRRDQPNLGTEQYWVGVVPGQVGAFPPEIQGLLDGQYRVPVAL